jgi:hypothetical protein
MESLPRGSESLQRGSRPLTRGTRSLPRESAFLRDGQGPDGRFDLRQHRDAVRHARGGAPDNPAPRFARGLGATRICGRGGGRCKGRAIEVIATYPGDGLSRPPPRRKSRDHERTPRRARGWIVRRASARVPAPQSTDNRQPAKRYPIAARSSGSADASSSACADATSSSSRASTASTDVPSRRASSRNTSR